MPPEETLNIPRKGMYNDVIFFNRDSPACRRVRPPVFLVQSNRRTHDEVDANCARCMIRLFRTLNLQVSKKHRFYRPEFHLGEGEPTTTEKEIEIHK